MEPRLIMLIGLPRSGKSTWRKTFRRHHELMGSEYKSLHTLSTDDYIERKCTLSGENYNESFEKYITDAQRDLYEELKIVTAYNGDIIWDQTNLTVTSRAKKLRKIPAHYYRIAVYFPKQLRYVLKNNASTKPSRQIPESVIRRMFAQLEPPQLTEPFDEIRIINSKDQPWMSNCLTLSTQSP